MATKIEGMTNGTVKIPRRILWFRQLYLPRFQARGMPIIRVRIVDKDATKKVYEMESLVWNLWLKSEITWKMLLSDIECSWLQARKRGARTRMAHIIIII